MYTQSYKDVFRLYSSGIHENVSLSFSERGSEVFGRIITHAFILFNIFPIEIARAFFEQLITNEVRPTTLLESFKSFIQKSERHSPEKLLSRKALSEETISGKRSRIGILIRLLQFPTYKKLLQWQLNTYLFKGRFLLCQKSGKKWVHFGMVSQLPTWTCYGIHIDQLRQTA